MVLLREIMERVQAAMLHEDVPSEFTWSVRVRPESTAESGPNEQQHASSFLKVNAGEDGS